jgi:hypothetical protein
MGISYSKLNKSKDCEMIDFIASHYIFTMNFNSLKKLFEKEYCNELILTVSNIIINYLNDNEIIIIAKRIKYGSQNMNKDNNHNDEFNDKKENSIYISKFYVKIAHIFSVILVTINPEYIYNNNDGTITKRKITNTNAIQENAIIEKINYDFNKLNERNEEMMGGDKRIIYNENDDDEGNDKNEYSIPEFLEFYYDSNYNINTGKFMDMSDKSKEDFNKDLLLFYKSFTQNEEELPQHIKKFSDIKLNNYYKHDNVCDKLTSPDNLFVMYANKMKKILFNINNTQKNLLEYINKLFVFDNDVEKIRVNPELTDVILQEMITELRTIIIELYISIETDFTESIQIYEAIVEMKLLKTIQNQVLTLEKEMEDLYYL